MMKQPLRLLGRPLFDWLARRMAGWRITANEVTLCGMIFGFWCCVMLAFQRYHEALFFLALNRMCDGLDGALARHTRMTELGRFLDIMSDFMVMIGAFAFFAMGRPEYATVMMWVAVAFAVDFVSLTALTIFFDKRPPLTQAARDRTKTLYPFGGLLDGTETLIMIVLMCLFPDSIKVLGVVYASLAWCATFLRMVRAGRYLH
jgi:phosphatidylglycerophosphate synthase